MEEPIREPWPLAAKLLAPLVILLIVAGIVAVLQPSPSAQTNPGLSAVKTTRTTTKSAPTPHHPRQPSATPPSAIQPSVTPPAATLPTATLPRATQPIVTPPPSTNAGRKTCADFARRIDAEIWLHYAIGTGLDTSGIVRGSNGVACPSLPGPDL